MPLTRAGPTDSLSSTPAHITEGSGDPSEPTVFLGESSPLTSVIDGGSRLPNMGYAPRPQSSRLRYAVPASQHIAPARNDFIAAHKQRLEQRLRQDGAFSPPPDAVSSTLLNAYFAWFHPCFPILDRVTVYDAFMNRTVSPLLWQAMYFIGISLCTDSAFNTTGFEDRYQAKFSFYCRAKAIYDADLESNVIIKLQSLFLLSFWRGGPSEERDTRSWLGAAINLAQKRGVHVM